MPGVWRIRPAHRAMPQLQRNGPDPPCREALFPMPRDWEDPGQDMRALPGNRELQARDYRKVPPLQGHRAVQGDLPQVRGQWAIHRRVPEVRWFRLAQVYVIFSRWVTLNNKE